MLWDPYPSRQALKFLIFFLPLRVIRTSKRISVDSFSFSSNESDLVSLSFYNHVIENSRWSLRRKGKVRIFLMAGTAACAIPNQDTECLMNRLQHGESLLAKSRDIGTDPEEDFSFDACSKAPGYFLLQFFHPDIPLSKIIQTFG